MRNLVVAHDQNRVIGAGGDIPWRGDLPVDMRHFRQLTEGHAVIMGRLTFESIGRPLPNRRNIVVSRATTRIAGCEVVATPEEGVVLGDAHEESFVIGGAQIYRATMPLMDRLYVTEVGASFEGDTYFDEIDKSQWTITNAEFRSADENNRYDSTFLTYERI